MLGTFLEFGVGARPTAESLEAYGGLGWRSVPVGDILRRYAVVSDGQVHIGLHEDDLGGPVPTFVRPDLKSHARALKRAGVEFEFLELADDAFHRAGFLDPGGHLVVLLEARTFPPPAPVERIAPLCGEFLELSLATHSLERSETFWRALGFEPAACGTRAEGSVRLHGHGLTLGLHETARFDAALSFRADNLAARRAFLEAKGWPAQPGTPLAERDAATLRLPGGLDAYLLGPDAAAAPASRSSAATT